jgi:phosphotransferase system enzyme I (PtsI)
MSRVLTGLGVSPGVVTGPVVHASGRIPLPPDRPVQDVEAAEAEVAASLEAVAADLDRLAAQAHTEIGGILTAQAMILRDPVLRDGIRDQLQAGGTRAGAVTAVFAEFKDALREGGEYFSERVADLDDLEYRVLAAILGVNGSRLPGEAGGADGPGGARSAGGAGILVAADLGPADVAGLRPGAVAAIVTEEGGATGHTAIIAKSLALPAVVGCRGATGLGAGTQVLVDGGKGVVTAAPAAAEIEAAVARDQARRLRLATSAGPGRTRDGHPVKLLVNADAAYQAAAAADSEGVGLLRTEFLYLDRADAPGVDEQAAAYRQIFGAFPGRQVTVRTLDAGSDKPLRFITGGAEPNPALGIRGLRVARNQPGLLATQLRAIALAAQGAPCEVLVMAPMVATIGEARDFALQARAHGLPTVGVMAEVPALALRARRVFAHCDFISLGTNDLAQYTFAADRTVTELAGLLDPWEPALLELVRLAAAAGLEHGRPVGVCGEAASDPLLALILAGLGVTSLSMAPVSLPEVRSALAGHELASCRRLAAAALDADDAASAREEVRTLLDAG